MARTFCNVVLWWPIYAFQLLLVSKNAKTVLYTRSDCRVEDILVSSSNVFGVDLCPNRNEIYEHLQPI